MTPESVRLAKTLMRETADERRDRHEQEREFGRQCVDSAYKARAWVYDTSTYTWTDPGLKRAAEFLRVLWVKLNGLEDQHGVMLSIIEMVNQDQDVRIEMRLDPKSRSMELRLQARDRAIRDEVERRLAEDEQGAGHYLREIRRVASDLGWTKETGVHPWQWMANMISVLERN